MDIKLCRTSTSRVCKRSFPRTQRSFSALYLPSTSPDLCIHLRICACHHTTTFCSRRGRAIRLTRDHKPQDPSEKSRIVAAGGFIGRFDRVNGILAVSRALGVRLVFMASRRRCVSFCACAATIEFRCEMRDSALVLGTGAQNRRTPFLLLECVTPSFRAAAHVFSM